MEMSAHRLVVSDTLRVAALHDAIDVVGKFHFVLFDHFVVLNDVDYSIRCNDSDAVECSFREFYIGNLDDAFFSILLAVEVETYSYAVVDSFNSEQIDNFE